MVETRAQLPFIGDQVVCLSHDQAARSGPASISWEFSTIPIVAAFLSYAVASGLVASLARPGGNVTGFSNIALEMQSKRLELLCDLVPQATVIALLVNPDDWKEEQSMEKYIRRMQEAAHTKGVQSPVLKVRTEGEIDTAFASLGELQAGGLVDSPDPFLDSRSRQLAALASRYAVPTISAARTFSAAGGLIIYGVDGTALLRQVGVYAGRILKGERPADLPVPAANNFRVGGQSQDRQSTGANRPALDLRPRRRGHRMTAFHQS